MASLGYRVVRCNTFADILRVLLGLASLSLLLVVWKKNADAWWDDEYNTYVIGGNAAACGVSVLRLLLGPLSARDYLRYGSVTLLFTALEAAIISIVLFFICQGDSPVVDCFRDPVDDLCIFVISIVLCFSASLLLSSIVILVVAGGMITESYKTLDRSDGQYSATGERFSTF